MQPVRLENTRISTDYVQKLPWTTTTLGEIRQLVTDETG